MTGPRWMVLLIVSGLGGGIALAAPTYSNPFHPEQCDLAIAAGKRWAASGAATDRAAAVRAEGLLCRGLEADDPWALEAALTTFRARAAADAGDFFTHLYLAEALARRFSLSDAAMAAFDRAAAVLSHADVGASRAELAAHIAQARDAIAARQRQFLPLLERRHAELQRGPLPAAPLAELLTLLAQTGPAGAEQALAVLDAQLAIRYDRALDTFQRAELLRGASAPEVVATLYQNAADALCRDGANRTDNFCDRVRSRLQQLERMRPKGG